MTDIISTDRVFSEQQKQDLLILVDMMIPAEGTMPGAADALIFSAILAGLADFHPSTHKLLSKLNEMSEERYQLHFSQLSNENRLNLVTDFRSSQSEFAQFLEFHAVNTYYQDDRVMLAFGLEARSPHPGGYQVEATDWSILDPVIRRNPIYKDV